MADSHRLHKEVQVPDGDLLIHAGDICHQGESVQTIVDFNAWLGELPHRLKIVVPGNHDVPLVLYANRKLLSNAIVLVNRGTDYMGLRIWGTPATALFGGAFGMWYPPDRQRLFARIPEDTDILITHGPPSGILDSPPGGGHHAGDSELLTAVQRVRPLLHVFGHVHAGHGLIVADETVWANAALLGEGGGIERDPIVLRIPRR